MNSKAVMLYDPENFLQSPSSYGWNIGNVAYPKTYEVREVDEVMNDIQSSSMKDPKINE